MESRSTQQGFTLVELAVVLICISIVSASVLKAQEMVRQARIKTTIAQVQSYQAAYKTFQDTYQFLPGDIPAAQAILPNCTAANSCFNGNGNKVIGSADTAAIRKGIQVISDEETQFWKHLVAAELITGVDLTTADIAWGKSHPVSPLTVGGFSVATSNTPDWQSSPSGFVMRIHPRLNIENIEMAQPAPTSPYEAGQIDRTIDDGHPAKGGMRTTAFGDPANDERLAGCEVEYTALPDKICFVYFKL